MINLGYVFHSSSCGYFCLRHVLKGYKVKRLGYMSLFDLKEVFMKHNYYCYCCKVMDLSNIKRECITLISVKNSFHYIVIKSVCNNYVYVYDPLFLFVRRVKREKFIKRWRRICLFYRKI